jgi:DNA-binding NarL/FixJ family response regulator
MEPDKQQHMIEMRPDGERAFKALIVDRDAMSGALLADALSRVLACEAMRIRSSDLLGTLEAGDVEVVIISADRNSKPGAGLDLARAAISAHPQTPIVLLLDQSTRDSVINAFRSGARGVFNREKSIAEFIDCVDHVRKGFIWADDQGATYLLEGIKSFPMTSGFTEFSLPTLTTRELQVVRSAAKGKGNRAIAAELGLSQHTIKNYLFHAFEKLGVSSRVELLVFLTISGILIGPITTEQMSAGAAD